MVLLTETDHPDMACATVPSVFLFFSASPSCVDDPLEMLEETLEGMLAPWAESPLVSAALPFCWLRFVDSTLGDGSLLSGLFSLFGLLVVKFSLLVG